MEYSYYASRVLASKPVAASAAVIVLGGAIGGYVVVQRHIAQNLAAQKAQNEQITAALNATRNDLNDLTAAVNMLASRSETQSRQPAPSSQVATTRRAATPRRPTEDPSFRKLQSQVDAQGKEIQETRNDLTSTRSALTSTRTELTGSIAHTHDELVLLQKRGERTYHEFDIQKSKQFQKEGPVGISLRKANTKHQYADLQVMVEDQNLSEQHVNLYQPVMFYKPDSTQPVEVVINNISKNHIHGYVSEPKYRQSELASMASADANSTPSTSQATNSNAQPSSRQKLAPPQ
jgi:hypothetical protein